MEHKSFRTVPFIISFFERSHMGLDQEVLRKRKEVYKKAKERHPERWAKGTRAWSFSEEEWLNPRQEAETKKEAKVS